MGPNPASSAIGVKLSLFCAAANTDPAANTIANPHRIRTLFSSTTGYKILWPACPNTVPSGFRADPASSRL
jgi:hypothetical protein